MGLGVLCVCPPGLRCQDFFWIKWISTCSSHVPKSGKGRPFTFYPIGIEFKQLNGLTLSMFTWSPFKHVWHFFHRLLFKKSRFALCGFEVLMLYGVHMATEMRVLCSIIVEKWELRSRGQEGDEKGPVRLWVQWWCGSAAPSILVCTFSSEMAKLWHTFRYAMRYERIGTVSKSMILNCFLLYVLLSSDFWNYCPIRGGVGLRWFAFAKCHTKHTVRLYYWVKVYSQFLFSVNMDDFQDLFNLRILIGWKEKSRESRERRQKYTWKKENAETGGLLLPSSHHLFPEMCLVLFPMCGGFLWVGSTGRCCTCVLYIYIWETTPSEITKMAFGKLTIFVHRKNKVPHV